MTSAYRYSSIETSYRCLRKYKLDYIDKLPEDGKTSIELAFGTGLHMALQASLENDDAHQAFNTYWDSLKQDLTHEEFRFKDYRFKAGEFLRKFDKMHKKHLEPVHLEQTIQGTIGGLQFEGTPDFVGMYKGVPSIIDFKTSQNAYLRAKILSNPQLPLYAELTKQALGFDAKQIIYMVFVKGSTSIQEPIIESLSKKLLTTALNSVILGARKLESLKGTDNYDKNFTACQIGSRVCSRFKNCFGGET